LELLLLIRRLLVFALLPLVLSACAGLFFQPYGAYVRTPAQLGLDYQDVEIETNDSVGLRAWFLPGSAPVCATVLFLHGNAENISTHIGSVYWLPARGFNVLLLDYRGYGASSGTPSFAGIQADIEAAVRYLLGRTDVGRRRIVVFGQSLGAAAAIYYVAHSAHRTAIRALIAESAFSGYAEIAREKMASFWLTWPFQWVPQLTVPTRYDPLAAVGGVSPIPLLIVHGEQDRIIPVEHGERLYAAAREPKELWRVAGAGHIETFTSERWRERLVAYLRERVCPELPDSGRLRRDRADYAGADR
jgi:fermentation-respiration switch protein FrsA (DUF1100 family)